MHNPSLNLTLSVFFSLFLYLTYRLLKKKKRCEIAISKCENHISKRYFIILYRKTYRVNELSL